MPGEINAPCSICVAREQGWGGDKQTDHRMLGGKIWAKSEYGVGTVFYFTLPLPGKNLEKESR